MGFEDLLKQTCAIYRKTVTIGDRGKTDITWTTIATKVKCNIQLEIMTREDYALQQSGERSLTSYTAARKLGYEFHVQRVETAPHPTSTSLRVTVTVTNTGVAPFYYPWPVELGILSPEGHLAATWKTSWDITMLQPGQPAGIWQENLPLQPLAPGKSQLLLRVANPLPGGHSIRFANITQDRHRAGWLTLLAIRR